MFFDILKHIYVNKILLSEVYKKGKKQENQFSRQFEDSKLFQLLIKNFFKFLIQTIVLRFKITCVIKKFNKKIGIFKIFRYKTARIKYIET